MESDGTGWDTHPLVVLRYEVRMVNVVVQQVESCTVSGSQLQHYGPVVFP
jgi:hypothetical protein